MLQGWLEHSTHVSAGGILQCGRKRTSQLGHEQAAVLGQTTTELKRELELLCDVFKGGFA